MSRNSLEQTDPWGQTFHRDQEDGSREQTLVLPGPSRSTPSLGLLIPPPGAGKEEGSQLAPRNKSFDCEDQLTPVSVAAALPTGRTGVCLCGPTPQTSPTHHLIYDLWLIWYSFILRNLMVMFLMSSDCATSCCSKPSVFLQHLVMEAQIPYLSIQGPLGSGPASHLLLTPRSTLCLNSNKMSLVLTVCSSSWQNELLPILPGPAWMPPPPWSPGTNDCSLLGLYRWYTFQWQQLSHRASHHSHLC